MNISDLTGKSNSNVKPLEEKATPNMEEITSIYGMDPSEPGHAEMIEELRVLRRADPGLYRKIVNLD